MGFVTGFRQSLAGFPRIALYTALAFALLGIFAPLIVPQDPLAQNLLAANQGSSLEHFLGTDHLGRDTLSRLIASARTSLVAMTLIIGFALIIGIGLSG